MNFGILTGGGDCPGLNAAIRSIALNAFEHGDSVIGFLDGWKGPRDDLVVNLDRAWVQDIQDEGGTKLGSSRTNPMRSEDEMRHVIANIEQHSLDTIIAIGGDDTLSVAAELSRRGIHALGIPKTIDNDVPETDYCIGFNSAVDIVTESVDRARTTARSHHRVIVVEVMGREAGWVAGVGGMASGAECVLVPEVEVQVDEVCERLDRVRKRGQHYAIVVAAEGISLAGADSGSSGGETDQFGHTKLAEKAVGENLAELIEERLGWESRSVVLGHIQRGGTPSAFDRVLATRFGSAAVECARSGRFGLMMALQGWNIAQVPLESIAGKTRRLDPEFIDQLRHLS